MKTEKSSETMRKFFGMRPGWLAIVFGSHALSNPPGWPSRYSCLLNFPKVDQCAPAFCTYSRIFEGLCIRIGPKVDCQKSMGRGLPILISTLILRKPRVPAWAGSSTTSSFVILLAMGFALLLVTWPRGISWAWIQNIIVNKLHEFLCHNFCVQSNVLTSSECTIFCHSLWRACFTPLIRGSSSSIIIYDWHLFEFPERSMNAHIGKKGQFTKPSANDES